MLGKINEFIIKNFLFLANHSNGIVIIKKVILLNPKNYLHEILKKILLENALNLIENAYGNYALQVAVEVNNY